MNKFHPVRHKAATAVFKLANKTLESGMLRALNQDPRGKGWVKCGGVYEGLLCKPDKDNEAIEYFKITYGVFPEIVALNQIALAYEAVGEDQLGVEYYQRMKDQALLENNGAYTQATEWDLDVLNRG